MILLTEIFAVLAVLGIGVYFKVHWFGILLMGAGALWWMEFGRVLIF